MININLECHQRNKPTNEKLFFQLVLYWYKHKYVSIYPHAIYTDVGLYNNFVMLETKPISLTTNFSGINGNAHQEVV